MHVCGNYRANLTDDIEFNIKIDKSTILYDSYAYFFASKRYLKHITITEKAGNNAKKALKLMQKAKNVFSINLENSLNISVFQKYLNR